MMRFWQELVQDIGLRTMAGNKTFSGMVTLSLVLGIGAKATIPILSRSHSTSR
jgi:hypothetical protein